MANDIPGIDPQTLQQIQGLLGLVNAQPEDLKKINSDKWINFGLGLMGARKGNELATVGNAGMNALAQANQERTQLQTQRGQNVQQAMNLLQMAKSNQALQNNDILNSSAAKLFAGAGQPTQVPSSIPAGQVGGTGMGGGTAAMFGAGTQPGPVAGPPVSTPAGPASQANTYRQLAQMYASAGKIAEAKMLIETADKLDAEFSTTPQTLMKDNVPTSVLIDKRGNVKPVDGFSPATQLHFADTGGQAGVGLNPYTGAQQSPGLPKVMSPGEKATNALGWAKFNAEDLGPMSDEAKAAAAARYNIDGTMPAMGMGKAARGDRKDILNLAAQTAKDIGVSPEDQRLAQISGHAGGAALTKLTQQATMVGAFERTFNKNADLALQMTSHVDNTGMPLANRWINAGKRSIAGDATLSTYDVAIKSTLNEYTKIISGAMGNTPMAESEIKRVEGMLNSAQNPEQVIGVINFMKKETANRMAGFKEEASNLKDSIKGGKTTTPATNTTGKTIKFDAQGNIVE